MRLCCCHSFVLNHTTHLYPCDKYYKLVLLQYSYHSPELQYCQDQLYQHSLHEIQHDSDVSILSETSHLRSRFQCLVDYLIELNLSNIGKPLISYYYSTNHQGDRNTEAPALRDKQILFLHLFVLWLVKTVVDRIYHAFFLHVKFLKLGRIYSFEKNFQLQILKFYSF